MLVYLIGLAIFLESEAKVSQNKQFRNTKKEFLKFFENIFYDYIIQKVLKEYISVILKQTLKKQFIIYLNIYLLSIKMPFFKLLIGIQGMNFIDQTYLNSSFLLGSEYEGVDATV